MSRSGRNDKILKLHGFVIFVKGILRVLAGWGDGAAWCNEQRARVSPDLRAGHPGTA